MAVQPVRTVFPTGPLNQSTEEDEQNASLRGQRDALIILTALSVKDAIGVSCSYLLHAAFNHPVILRRVMNEQVVREGFRGESLLDVIKRVCR